MAQHAEHEYKPGSQDISQNVKTWQGFTKLTLWSVIGCGIIAVLLALFRT